MINIQIGNCSDDSRVIHKNFNVRAEITGEINFPSDELNPELIVSRETIENSDNYCYIPYFNRYYYIVNKVHDGKRKILTLAVDVLKTYENELQNVECTVIRNSLNPTYIVDDKMPINTNSFYMEGKYFPLYPWTFSPNTIGYNIVLSVISQSEVV